MNEVTCPACGSKDVWRIGYGENAGQFVQCKKCGYIKQ